MAAGFCLLALSPPAVSRPTQADYATEVFQKVAARLVTPAIASPPQQPGQVTCAIAIDAAGQVTDVVVEGTSGMRALDDAALKAVRAAAPFDPPPHGATVVHGRLQFDLNQDPDDE